MIKIHIITIFPKIFESYFNESIIKRALVNKKARIIIHDLRKWTFDKHKTVDDRPYGGGAGMVLKPEPIISAIGNIKLKYKNPGIKVILLSAKGRIWNQKMAKKNAQIKELILICGRYEGVDERVKHIVDEEISIGKYILTGGEIPAMAIVDSLIRLIPGVLGNELSAEFESYSENNLKEHPHFTRPDILEINGKILKVPKVLLSGDHKKIDEWRKKKSKK
jgi:tRNA (guanine37-N1)-methyltransferase